VAKEYKVKARIEAEDAASPEIDKVSGKFGGLATTVTAVFAVAIAAATAALYGLSKALQEVIGFADVQQSSIVRLDAALAPLGDKAAGVSKRLQEQASALQLVTRFGDETIIQGQALVASFTKNETVIKQATKAALDLSAATGTRLNAAFLLLAKAAAGETSSLSRYGIILDQSVPKSEKFAAAIAQINANFGGQAEAQARTYSGLLQQISNAYGDLKEKLGFAIIENEKVLELLTKIRDVLSSGKLVELVDDLAEKMAKYATATATAADESVQFARGVSQTSGALIDYIGYAITGEAETEKLRQSMGKAFLRTIVDDRAVQGVRDLINFFGGVADAADQVTEAERASEAQSAKLAASFQKKVEEALKYGRSLESATEAFNELREAEGRAIDESDEFIAWLKELGITLESELVEAWQRNNKQLERASELLRQGVITRRDFERIERRVIDTEWDANDALFATNEALEDSNRSFGDAAQGAEGYARSLEGATAATRRLREEEAAAALARAGPGGSAEFGGTITGGGSKLFPNSAVANTAVRNGQLVFVGTQRFRQ
jgi:hypothetical protein